MEKLIISALLFIFAHIGIAQGQTVASQEAKTEAQKEFEKNEKEVRNTADRLAEEKKKYDNRDKSLDNRYPVGKDLTVSGERKGDKVEVNVRKDY